MVEHSFNFHQDVFCHLREDGECTSYKALFIGCLLASGVFNQAAEDLFPIVRKTKKKKRKKKGTLAEFFAMSPLRTSGLKLTSLKGRLRKPDL